MNQPYRELAKEATVEEPKPTIPDATDGEVAFWERVYVGAVSRCLTNEGATKLASTAVLDRRKAFGHDTLNLTPWNCSTCKKPINSYHHMGDDSWLCTECYNDYRSRNTR